MSLIRSRKLGNITSRIANVRDLLGGRSERGASRLKHRRLAIDRLEERNLLSVAPADWDDVTVNERMATEQATLPGQSVAVDHDGDFVVVWTRYDEVLQEDADGNPILDPDTGLPIPVEDPETGLPMTDANIYARYFTDEVQQLELPAGLVADSDGNGIAGSFYLTYNGNEVQKISITATYQPFYYGQSGIAGSVTLGFDVDGGGNVEDDETATIFFSEYDPLDQTANNFQESLQGLGGALTDATVVAVNPHEFLVKFGDLSLGQDQPEIEVKGVSFTSGFLPAVLVSTVHEPVVIGPILISPDNPYLTALSIEQAFLTTTESFYMGPINFPPSDPVPAGDSSRIDYPEGPYTEPLVDRDPVPGVTVVPVLETDPVDMSVKPSTTRFDITFDAAKGAKEQSSGKKNHPELLMSGAVDDQGNPGIDLDGSGAVDPDELFDALTEVTTLKEPSQEFRVNPEEPDNPFTWLPDRLDQTWPDVAMDADGEFVITWQSEVPEKFQSVTDIFARRFTPTGIVAPEDVEFFVDMDQDAVAETPVQGVRALVSPEVEYVQRITFDATGAGALVGTFRLEIDGSETEPINFDSGDLEAVEVAMEEQLEKLGHRDVDVSVTSEKDPYQFEVRFKTTFNLPMGEEDARARAAIHYVEGDQPLAADVTVEDRSGDLLTFRVNTETTNAQAQPTVDMDDAGNFVIAWATGGQDLSFFNLIKGQRYSRNGRAVDQEFALNQEDTSLHYDPYVAMSHDGHFLVTWTRTDDPNAVLDPPDSHTARVMANVYDPDGQPLVTQWVLGGGGGSSAAFDMDNNFIVAWSRANADPDNIGANSTGVRAVMRELYDAQGNFSGAVIRDEFRVNSANFDTTSAPLWPLWQFEPHPGLDADGDLIISYEGFGPDVSEEDVYIPGTYFEDLINSGRNADLLPFFDPQTDYIGYWYYRPGSQYYYDDNGSVDGILEHVMIEAFNLGATDEQVGRLRALLEQRIGLLRGDAWGAMFSRFDADPQIGDLNLLMSDCVANAYRDGHNQRYILTIPSSTTGGNFTVDLTHPNRTGWDRVQLSPVYQNNVMNRSRTAKAIEEALIAASRSGLNWPGDSDTLPFEGTVNVRIIQYGYDYYDDEILARMNTPWDLANPYSYYYPGYYYYGYGVLPTDVVFEITFQGEVHDTMMGLYLYDSNLNAQNVEEIQLLTFNGEATGNFALQTSLGTTGDMLFDPNDPNFPDTVAWDIEYELWLLGHVGATVTALPGGPPYQFMVVFPWAGANEPPMMSVPPMGGSPYPSFIDTTTLQEGSADTAPPPAFYDYMLADEGTTQGEVSLGVEPDGDFVMVWTQYEEYTSGAWSNQNIYYRRFDEDTDTAGPQVTDLSAAGGLPLGQGESIDTSIYHLVLTFDEDMMRTGFDSVSNPDNYRLLSSGIEIDGGVAQVQFGMNMAAQLAGRIDPLTGTPYETSPIRTNKWEAVITLDANGVEPGIEPLGGGLYTIQALAPIAPTPTTAGRYGLRDKAGNPLRHSGFLIGGADFLRDFVITGTEGDGNGNGGGGADYLLANPGRTYPESAQAVAVDADGDHIAVWTAADRVYYQVFDSDGTPADLLSVDPVTGVPIQDSSGNFVVVRDAARALPVTPSITHPDFIGDTQRYATVATDEDGDFVVTWTNYRGGDADVYARRFDSMGEVAGIDEETGNIVFKADASDAFRVNQYTDDGQKWSHVAVDADGDFVVTWSSYGQEDNGQLGLGYGVYARRYDSFGMALGPEFRVNVTTVGNQQFSTVDMDAMGGFVIAWTSDQNGIGDDIIARLYEPDGSPTAGPLTGEFVVNVTTDGNQRYPNVATDLSGERFVITWSSSGQDGEGWGVYARTFERIGVAGSELLVNTTTTGHQMYSSVALSHLGNALDTYGDFVVTWSGYGDLPDELDTSGFGVFAQRFLWDGTPEDGTLSEMRINRQTVGNQWLPSVDCDGEGNFVIVWTGEGVETGMTGAYKFVSSNSPTRWAKFDSDGPIVTDVINPLDGARVLDGDVLEEAAPGIQQLVMLFGERLCMVDEAGGLNSVLNPANWSLERNGTEIVGGIKEIQFGRSVATRKYGALVTFDGNGLDVGTVPLLPGDYVLAASDMVTDGLNALDGDYDGVAGTSPAGTGYQGFRFHFAVGGGGAEFRINENTTLVQTFAEPQGTGYALEQSNQTVAVDHDGDFVVVWTSYGQDDPDDPDGAGVYFRMYDRNNVPLTGEVLVNTVTTGDQRDASVAMDADGEFVVVWEAPGDNPDGSWGVYGRRFSSTGTPLSGQFRVNTNTQHDQLNPAVGMDDFGNFAVVWGTKGQQFSSFNEVRGQLYNYRGERIGGEFQVNQTALQAVGLPSGEIEVNPAVAVDPNGAVLAAWEVVTSQWNGVITGTAIAMRYFPSSGSPFPEFTVGAGRNAQLASSAPDQFVFAYEQMVAPADFDVFVGTLDVVPGGLNLVSVVANMLQFGGAQVNPSVGVDADGDLAVVWNGNGGHPDPVTPWDPNLWGDLDPEGVFIISNSAGNLLNSVSVQSRVNRTDAGIQQFPSIGMEPDGDHLVVWSGAGVGDRHGIFARRYNEPSDTAGPLVSDFQMLTGERIEFGAQVTQALTHLVVVFDEEMMTSGLDSVTDVRNYRLLKDGVQLMGGIRSIQFGLNPSTNKWEAALELDGNGAGAGVEPLGNGHYELIVRNSLRDVVGNPLGRTGALPNGQDYSGEFTITAWVGADNVVNDPTAGDQITRTFVADAPEHSPQAVAGDADGECVMVWSDTTPGQEGVYAKLYNDLRWSDSATGRESTGPVPGEAILVTDAPTASFASVARDADGDFVVTWSQNDGTGLNPDWNVWARRYDATGNPFGEPFLVNTETENAQRYSAVAMDQDGDFVVTWQSYGQDGSGYGVYAQRYGPSGERLGGVDEVQLLTFVDNPVGTFKLSWDGDGNPATPNVTGTIQVTGNPFGIVGEVEARLNQLAINAAGKQVNQVEVYPLSLTELAIQFVGSGSSQDQAQITVLSKAFDHPSSDLTATTLADGLSGEFQVNDSVDGNQMFPAIAMKADGDFVVSWTSDGSAGGQTDVYAKRFVTNDAYRFTADTPQGQRYDWDSVREQSSDIYFAVSTDDPMNHVVDPGGGYDGVVQLMVGGGAGTGSLLRTGRHILTAAHVVEVAPGVPATSIDVWFDLPDGPTVMTATQAFIHPGWNGDIFNANDLAIVVLPQEAPPEAERYDIYRGTDELHHVIDMVGYGTAGQGAEQFFDFLKRTENNVFEVYGEGLNGVSMDDFWFMGPGSFDIPSGKLLVYDFDSGLAQNDALGMAIGVHDLGLGEEEGTSSHGDSGGPGFLYGQIVSVVSGGVEYTNADSDFVPGNVSFGTVGFHTRVSAYADWIDLLSRSTGSEFLVNDTTAGDQKWSSVAMDADGDFVITWTSYGQDGGGGGYGAGYYGQEGVFAKRYNSDGSEYVYLDPATGLPVVDPITGLPRVGEFQVNRYTVGSQQHPQVAMDADGDFTIVWESYQNTSGSAYDDSPSSFGVYAQRYARNDQVGVGPFLGPNGEIGGELPINATKAGDQRFPCVAVDDTGDAVIVWSGFGEGDAQGVFYQRFEKVGDNAGPTVADVVAVNIADGQVVLEQIPEDYVLDFDVEQMVISFSEDLVDDSTTALESITNLNNWDLMRDGQVVRRGVSSVVYGLNRTSDPTLDPRLLYGPTNKYEVVVTLDGDPDVAGAQSLGPGEYWLTIRDYVEDQFGNRLDGDVDGTPGMSFTRTFFVSDVAGGDDQDGDGMPDGVGDPDLGDEDETVHYYEIGNQDSPAVASNAAGDYVVVWVDTSDVLDPITGAVMGQDSNIVARRFDRFGEPQGGKFIVNSYRIGDQVDPDVAMDAYGNFVVTWSGEGEVNGSSVVDDSGVFARVFDAFGKPVGEQFQVNQFRQNTQDAPSVAMDADGDLVVSWTSYGQDGEKDGVYARRYNFLGEAQSDEFLVNSTWRNRQDQSDVAMDAQGNFVVIWAGYRQSADNSEWGIYGQRYDAAGGRQGGEFLVNTYTQDDQLDPQIAMSAGGDFVVTWSSEIQDGSGWGVYGRRYTAAGVPKAGEFRANQTTLHWQRQSAVSMDDAGNFVVTWTTTDQDNQDFPDQGIYARVFDAAGNDLYVDPDTGGPLGEFRINATVQGDQFDSAVAMDADGDFVTVWVGPDADGNGVYSRLVRVNAPSGGVSPTPPNPHMSFYYAGEASKSPGGDPAVLNLAGTSGSDVFEFVAGPTPGSSTVKVNGVVTPVGSSVTSILFNGVGGQDTAVITGTAADETAETWPGRVMFTGVGYTVDAVDVESVTVTGGGGADVAKLHDRPDGDEVLITAPNQISMSGDGFSSEAFGFRYGHGYSTGGNDVAKLYDDPQGDETFQVAPTHSVLFNDAFTSRAVGFAYVHAYSRGGNDVAKLYDDPADDETFLVSPGFSTLSNENFFTRAVGFRYVHAYSSGGTDVGKMYDYPGQVDTFTTTPGYSVLSNDISFNRAFNFAYVHAYSSDSDDVAKLYDDPDQQDTFVGTAEAGAMSNGAFFNRAVGFRYVHAYASGDQDLAKLYDDPDADDLFVGKPGDSTLSNGTFANRAVGFPSVHAYSLGGADLAKLYDSDGDDTFVGNPTEAVLSGPGFSNRAVGFSTVKGYASGAGHDVAYLHDSALEDFPDHLEAKVDSDGKWAKVSNAALGYVNWVFDFEEVQATSSNKEDTKDIGETVDFLIANGYW